MSLGGYERMLMRREQHKSRSSAIVVALVIVALAAAYLGTEAVLRAIGQPALLITPGKLLKAIADGSPWVGLAAAVSAVLGIVFVLLAILPARRSRHRLADDRVAVVVDDDVLAGAVSRTAATAAAVPHGQVRTAVGRRSARVDVRPTTGFAVDSGRVRSDVDELLTELQPQPRVRADARVAQTGVV